MALFSFTDIKFTNKIDARKTANMLTESNQYNSSIMRFPLDIGSVDKGHYMVIHINEQTRTQFADPNPRPSDNPTIFDNKIAYGASNLPKLTIDTVNKLGQKLKLDIPTLGNASDSFNISFLRTIRRTASTIALYMPDTLQYTHNQSYSDLSLSGALSAAVSTAQSIDEISKNISNKDISGLLKNFSPFIARAFQSSDLLRAVYAGYTGKVINPMMEMIYTTPAFREFRFDFMFHPRSEKEAAEVHKIIEKLKFYQAPEIDTTDGGLGFFLVPPSEFDIKFYYNGVENPNIPKISTCVLTSLDVDYAPNGFAAYEVPGENNPSVGRTGSPVGIRLSLQFKETEIMTKNNFKLDMQSASEKNSGISDQYRSAGQVNEKGEGLF